MQCRNLRKEFGDHEVFKSVSFDLAIGDRLGLAGKTAPANDSSAYWPDGAR